MGTQQAKGTLAETIDGIDPLIRNVQSGRFEWPLSAVTSVGIFPEPPETTKGPAAGPRTRSEQRRWRKPCLRTATTMALPVEVENRAC